VVRILMATPMATRRPYRNDAPGGKCALTRHPTTESGQAAGLSLSVSLCQARCSS
jgi:hypothetical protein